MWKHSRAGKFKAHWRKARADWEEWACHKDMTSVWDRSGPGPTTTPEAKWYHQARVHTDWDPCPIPRGVLLSPLAGTAWHRASEQLSSADGPSLGDLSSRCYRRSQYVGHAGHPWVTAKPPSPLSQTSRRQAEHSTRCPQEAASWGTPSFLSPQSVAVWQRGLPVFLGWKQSPHSHGNQEKSLQHVAPQPKIIPCS